MKISGEAIKEAELAVQHRIAGMLRTQQESETVLKEQIVIAEQARTDAGASTLVISSSLAPISTIVDMLGGLDRVVPKPFVAHSGWEGCSAS